MITDEEMKKWEEMIENDKEEEWLYMKMMDSLKLRKIDSDNYEVLFDNSIIVEKLKNCHRVSEEFIKNYFEEAKEIYLESIGDKWEDVDMDEMVDEAIREGCWDWRKEVGIYKRDLELQKLSKNDKN